MIKKWMLCAGTISIVSLSGCATGTRRGSVVMKINDTEAHVALGKDDVSTGDHVELYRNVCTRDIPALKGGSGGQRSCSKEEFGHGKVVQVLNENYSIVEFPPGTQFSEGDTVEKHSH